eukprot:g54384.t1
MARVRRRLQGKTGTSAYLRWKLKHNTASIAVGEMQLECYLRTRQSNREVLTVNASPYTMMCDGKIAKLQQRHGERLILR